jgi:hypothetical protein
MCWIGRQLSIALTRQLFIHEMGGVAYPLLRVGSCGSAICARSPVRNNCTLAKDTLPWEVLAERAIDVNIGDRSHQPLLLLRTQIGVFESGLYTFFSYR